ncbi:MAG: acetate/propionate family kinase [Bacteroidia bacterium]
MTDYVLILNAGSSSLKFRVYSRPDAENWQMASRGQVDGIGTAPVLIAKDNDGKQLTNQKLDPAVKDAKQALDVLAGWLRSQYNDAHILGVGHRVVHGGTDYYLPTLVTEQVLADLQKLNPLAPLHQPFNLAAIEAVFQRLPDVPQVACFDTGFHRNHDAVMDLIPVPKEMRDKGVQRYGFHGLSYEYISSVLPQVAPAIASGRVIVAHLGSGASLCAMKNGKSIDSTLGFTALDGLCMGTRPGSLDAGVVLYFFQTLGLSAKEVESMLYKKSGLLGISGISNDMRILLERSEPEAKLAVDYFIYRIAKEIGALTAVLGGLDALVFTAGIGENSPAIRLKICKASAWLGIELNEDANERNEVCITNPQSKVSAWVIPTDEELMIARHMKDLLVL